MGGHTDSWRGRMLQQGHAREGAQLRAQAAAVGGEGICTGHMTCSHTWRMTCCSLGKSGHSYRISAAAAEARVYLNGLLWGVKTPVKRGQASKPALPNRGETAHEYPTQKANRLILHNRLVSFWEQHW